MTPLDREKQVVCRVQIHCGLMTEWEVTTLTWHSETHNRVVGVGWVFPIHFLHLERAAPHLPPHGKARCTTLSSRDSVLVVTWGVGKKAEHIFQRQHPPKPILTIKVIPRHTCVKHDEKQGQELMGIFWLGNN